MLIIAGIVFAAVLMCGIAWLQWKLIKTHETEQARKKRIALQLDPIYRRKVQEDRAHELALARLALERERFQLEAYLALHRPSPETYLVNEVTSSIEALPSLKRAAPEQSVTAPMLASPQVRQPSMQALLHALEPGALQVAPGIKVDTGELVILSIELETRYQGDQMIKVTYWLRLPRKN